MEERYSTFSLLLLNISRCVQKIKNVEMAALGLKGTQVQCLFELYRAPEGVPLTKLCALCGEDKGKLSRTVKELSEKELVFVETSGGRKYKNPLRLTEKGKDVAGVVAEKISSMLGKGSFGMSKREREGLYRSLTVISDNLSEICKTYPL